MQYTGRFIQQKRRKIEVPDDDVNWQIRNHQNGFIYSHQDVDKVITQAMNLGLTRDIEAIEHLLTFGAIDVVVKKDGTYSILEVNTACGIEGETVEFYKNNLGQVLQMHGAAAHGAKVHMPRMKVRGVNDLPVDDAIRDVLGEDAFAEEEEF